MDKYPPEAQDLKDYIQSRALSSRDISDMLKVSSSTVRHWMSGKQVIPYTAWHTLRVKTIDLPEVAWTHDEFINRNL